MDIDVKSVAIERRVSKKTGKEYSVLVVVFPNGYKYENFLTNEQDYIIRLCLSGKK